MQTYTKASRTNEPNARESRNLAVAYQAACESIVLLKNTGALPFTEKNVALYGAGASMTIKGGTGSGEVNERHSVTVLEGMRDRGFRITSTAWLDDYTAGFAAAEAAYKIEKRKRLNIFKLDSIMQMLFDNFRAPAGRSITPTDIAASDTAQCLYILSRQAGEGGDRKLEQGDYFLTDAELDHIRFCSEHYEKFVLVINCGSSIDMSVLSGIDGIDAILYICQLGTAGGHAVADIVSGAVTPSGKLADSWAKQYGDIPFAHEYSGLNGNLAEEYYREGIYVGYRYFDSFGVAPAFPFGYGMSYTDFSVTCTGLSAEGGHVRVSAAVTNIGDRYAGKEVVQLYVSAPNGTLAKAYQSLTAFAKTETLAPQQKQALTLSFDIAELASYRESDSSYILEAGDYTLRLGNSSRNTVPVGILRLDAEITVSKHEPICPVQTPIEELCAPVFDKTAHTGDLPTITVNADTFRTTVYGYVPPAPCADTQVNAFLDTLSLKEMIKIVVGIGMFGGKKRFHLPGSVGNTTSAFWDRGLVNVALCDGPAGLRLQKRSTIDKNGTIKPVEMAMSVFNALPNFIKRFMLGNPEKDPVLYQYTTAFPVAAALAQSWNTALMYEIGTAILEEMREYGCTYWLAPAINIHRNPLCGRNFEYFSEDPFLTGTLAAAIIRGVQQEEGFYVTVKHFCCNNQEDNRNYVSSNVSERTLREIYLRGFALSVQQGGAKGIMTSYNKVNGCYTANSYDLCTKVLRNEWGFDGVVMTDWFSTNRGQASSASAMAAGNDLIMPGGSSFKKQILRGVQKGDISEADVRRCCANVVRAIRNSATQREYIG